MNNDDDFDDDSLQTQSDTQDDLEKASSYINLKKQKNKDKAAGKRMRLAGKALHLSGQLTEASGEAVQKGGKAVKQVGKYTYNGGKRLFQVGRNLCATGYGAIAGIPMCIAAVGIMGIGLALEGMGWGLIQLGKAIAIAGRQIQKAAQAVINKANQKIRDAGGNAPNESVPVGKKGGGSGESDEGVTAGGIPGIGAALKANKMKIIIIAVIILLVIFLVLYVLLDRDETIKNGGLTEGDETNVPYQVSKVIIDKLVIANDKNGKYTYGFKNDSGEIVDIDQAIDSTLQKLKEAQSGSLDYLGDNDTDRKKLLKKMLMAEIATQYPNMNNSEDVGLAKAKDPSETESTNASVAGCDVNIDVTVKENFITDYDKLNTALSSKFASLADHTQDFLNFQEKYGINAIFIAGICIWETTGGTKGHAVDGCHNWTSIKFTTSDFLSVGSHGEFCKYANDVDSIESAFELISQRGSRYVKGGNKTVAQIIGQYNSGDSSEPGNIAGSMADMYAAVGITSVTGGIQSDGTATTSGGTTTGNETISSNMNLDNKINGGVNVQRKDEDTGETTTLKYTSTDNFNKLLSQKSEKVFEYYTLQRNTSAGGSNGTQQSASNVSGSSAWGLTVSYENWPAYRYHHGLDDLTASSNLVSGYITEDRKNYIVTTTDGRRYAGPGVQLESNINFFKEEGIDISTLKVGSLVDCDIVERVSKKAYEDSVNSVKKDMEKNGVTLTENQIYAVADVYYMNGAGAGKSFWTAYAKYGNTDELGKNYGSFNYVPENTTQEDLAKLGHGTARRASRWILFKYGKYVSNVKTYNPEEFNGSDASSTASAGNATSAGTTSTDGDFSGSNNAEIIWNYLKSKGLSDVCVAAIIGNLMMESTLDTGAVEDNGVGLGLAQWSYDRRNQLEAYAKAMNKPATDIQIQLRFLWMETDPSADKTYAELQWKGNGYEKGEPTYNLFKSAKTVEEATTIFCWAHERPDKKKAHYSRREEEAIKAYNLYSGKSGTSTLGNPFDKTLFIGDSRYGKIKSELSALGSGVNVLTIDNSKPVDWVKLFANGAASVNGTTISLPETVNNVSVLLGINDTTQTAQMKDLLNKIHGKDPNATVFVNSEYSVGTAYSGTETNETIQKYNDEIRNYCNQNSWCNYLDITNGLSDDSGSLKSEYTSDGLNVDSDKGKKVLVDNIKAAITVAVPASNSNTAVAGKTSSGYSIIVANKTSTLTSVTRSYNYSGSYQTDIGHGGKNDNSKRFSDIKGGQISQDGSSSYTQTSVAYQDALTKYTLHFNFLWAILVDTENSNLVNDWADLVCNNVGDDSKITVTVYTKNETTTSESSSSRKETFTQKKDSLVTTDRYNVTDVTTTTTSTTKSNIAVTSADTWLVNYENNADTYSEYQSKSKEKITEKTSLDNKSQDSSSKKDSKQTNAIKILRSYSATLDTLKREKDMVKEMLATTKKLDFMSDVFDYILKAASGVTKQEKTLSELLDASSFDLETFIPTDNINSNGVSGEGASGGSENNEAGDGYKTTFSVGTRVYKNFKQSDGSWNKTYVSGWKAGSNMFNSGCGLTSIAVIATGYGLNVTPGDVAALVNSGQYGYEQLEQILNHYIGKSCNWQYSNINENIINQLKAGKPVMVHTKYYGGHFFCILAISDDGSQVYVSDVGGYYVGEDRNGWKSLSFLNRFDRCMLIGD